MTQTSAILPPVDSSRTQSTISVRVGQRRGMPWAGRVTGSARECTAEFSISNVDREYTGAGFAALFDPGPKLEPDLDFGKSPSASWGPSEVLRASEKGEVRPDSLFPVLGRSALHITQRFIRPVLLYVHTVHFQLSPSPDMAAAATARGGVLAY